MPISFKWAATALLLLLAAPAGAQAPAETPVNMTGQWVLNEELSQDLAATMKAAMGGGARSGGGMRGGGGGGMRGGGMGGAGDRRPGAEENAGDATKRQQQALRMQQEYSRLEIFHEGPELNLTNGLDITQLHFTDGRESTVWTERGEMKARTGWKGKALCIETSGRGPKPGPGRTRTFSLSEDGSQLVLVEERPLPGQKEPVRIRMVYDRVN